MSNTAKESSPQLFVETINAYQKSGALAEYQTMLDVAGFHDSTLTPLP